MSVHQKMTPEIQKKLEGLLPVTSAGVKFTPDVYFELKGVPKEFIPSFHQRGWTKEEEVQLLSSFDDKDTFNDDFLYEITRKTILGFYLPDLDGNKIEYKADPNGGCAKEVWDGIQHGLKIACYKNAQKLSGLGMFTKQGLES